MKTKGILTKYDNDYKKTCEYLSSHDDGKGGPSENGFVKSAELLYDFDKIVSDRLGTSSKSQSTDGISLNDSTINFIEFKDSSLRNSSKSVQAKAIYSVLNLAKILYNDGAIKHHKDIHKYETRFILVYSQIQNPGRLMSPDFGTINLTGKYKNLELNQHMRMEYLGIDESEKVSKLKSDEDHRIKHLACKLHQFEGALYDITMNMNEKEFINHRARGLI